MRNLLVLFSVFYLIFPFMSIAEGKYEVNVVVLFSYMDVIDDKEGGDGDWRITCWVNNERVKGTPVYGEAGTGKIVKIDKRYELKMAYNDSLYVKCKVEEHDGGFDNEWEFLDAPTMKLYVARGSFNQYFFEIDDNEGHVKIHYTVVGY